MALGTFAAVGCAPQPREVTFPAPQPVASAAPGAMVGVPVGMSGCLGAACHGAPARDTLAGKLDATAWQSSGSHWAAADPHTAAYSLLTDHPHRPVKVTAGHIMARYAPGTRAEDDARCVACHTNPALAAAERFGDPHARLLRNEGVSCEACHGGAGGWLREHTSWTGDRRPVYAKTGMTPLFDLGERAMTCLGCHVGAPAENGLPVRDMNHDMIAAGHPRLNFDFAEYLRRLPAHWMEKDRTTNSEKMPPKPLNAAKAWLVGRTAHAEAACKLLESRATRSATDPRTPWPEFAEYNCASCHHNLRAAVDKDPGANWRKESAYLDGRPIGLPPWQTIWPLTPAAGMPKPTRADSVLKPVLVVMEGRRRPDPAKAAGAAGAMVGPLKTRLADVAALPDAEAIRQARELFPDAAPQVPEWDAAAQMFFGMAALERARRPDPKDVPAAFRTGLDAFRADNWKAAAQALDEIRTIQKARP